MKPMKIGDLTARIPVIQGGMGVGISLSGLAGAVAANGGIGVLSAAQIGYREPDFESSSLEANLRAIASEISKARDLAAGGVLGINIMVATRQYADYVKAAVKAGIDLIISGAGLPTMLPELVKESKTKIAPIVSTIKSAQVICKLWDRKYKKAPDLVVIEGPRAGGHLGFSLEQLAYFTPEIYQDEIRGIIAVVKTYAEKYQAEIPVVVAGGIYDKNDVANALKLQADGVQMGTRFVTTYECDASDAYKQTYINSRQDNIRIVKSPVGLPGRAISNPFLNNDQSGSITKCYRCLERCNPAKIPYCITKALVNAVKGNTDEALLFCGDNAWKAEKMEHVSDIMKEISGE